MKILAAINFENRNGSDYWRLTMPLNHLGLNHGCEIRIAAHLDDDVPFMQDGKPITLKSILEEVDLVVIGQSFCSQNFAARVKYIQSFCPVVMDIDDYWHLPTSHPLHKQYAHWKIPKQIEERIGIVDAVTTTNETLAAEIRRFNPNVYVIPNAIDPNMDQWKTERVPAEILRLGYMGANFHASDLKCLTEPVKKLYRLEKWFRFQLYGYNKDSKDSCIYELILSNRMPLNDRYKHYVPEENDRYAKGYANIDVSLAPLMDNLYNRCKSNLKMLEAAHFGIPIITNNAATYPDLINGVNGFLTTNWLMTFQDCINDREMVKAAGLAAQETFKDKTLKQINHVRLNAYAEIINNKQPVTLRDIEGTVKVVSICYNEKQTADYTRFDNPRKSIADGSYLFEYLPMIELMKEGDFKETDIVGILSHKHRTKTGLTPTQLHNLLMQNEDSDVFGISPVIYKSNYLKESFRNHPGLKELLTVLCHLLDLQMKEPEAVVYSNGFLAKLPVYKKYIEEIIKPAIALMEDNQAIRTMAWKDSMYNRGGTSRMPAGLFPEQLKAATGLDYYPLHTFALERLFSIWLQNNTQIKFTQLI